MKTNEILKEGSDIRDLPQGGKMNVAREAFKDLERYIDLLQEIDSEGSVYEREAREIAHKAQQALKQYGSALYHATGKHPNKR